MPRPRRVAHAPHALPPSDPAAAERECPTLGLAVRNRRATAFIHGEGRQLPPTLSLALARLSGKPRHREHLLEVLRGAPERRDGSRTGSPDHHAVDGGLALVPVKAPR